jgi:hypothetical protein
VTGDGEKEPCEEPEDDPSPADVGPVPVLPVSVEVVSGEELLDGLDEPLGAALSTLAACCCKLVVAARTLLERSAIWLAKASFGSVAPTGEAAEAAAAFRAA